MVKIFPESSPQRHKGHKEERARGQTGHLPGLAAFDGADPSTATWRFALEDHLGSPRAYLAQSKAAVALQDFSPYGELMRSAGLPLTIGYTGHPWDRALGQYFAPFRYYNPATARWNMRDPLGFVDGPNVYAYVAGNPVGYHDLLGLECDDKGNTKSKLDRNIPDYTDGADPRTGEPPRPEKPKGPRRVPDNHLKNIDVHRFKEDVLVDNKLPSTDGGKYEIWTDRNGNLFLKGLRKDKKVLNAYTTFKDLVKNYPEEGCRGGRKY